MKRIKLVVLAFIGVSMSVYAGNDEKRGQAGATQLLINPWSKANGWAGAYTSGVRGVESMNQNVAGLGSFVRTNRTEFVLSNSQYLVGSGVSINSFGFAQKVGEGGGCLGISITSMNLGDFYETTVDRPEGTGRIFKPQIFNGALAYSKIFSDRITGGLLVRVLSEGVSSVSAFGVTVDAGVQYHAGEFNEFKFGVALRNVGPNMRYSGEGLSQRADLINGNTYNYSNGAGLVSKSNSFQMPALLNLGLSYDFNLDMGYRITAAGNFTSNTYTNDNFHGGVEFGYKDFVAFRAGLLIYKDVFNPEVRTDVSSAPSFGVTLQLPFGDEKISNFGFDYSYRSTNPFNGTHTIGLHFSL